MPPRPASAPRSGSTTSWNSASSSGQGNALGEPIAIGEAEDHLFGVCLLNDWSARDMQAWEYQPLGPFLSKNFATTLSPWIVTMEALAPFRAGFERPPGDPQPLPYLDAPANRERGALDIVLEVWLQTAAMREAGEGARASHAQQHRAGRLLDRGPAGRAPHGQRLQPSAGRPARLGHALGSRARPGGLAARAHAGGKQPITLPNGEKRTFLEDGDTLILRGHCERDGAVRIGFGEVSGTVLAP